MGEVDAAEAFIGGEARGMTTPIAKLVRDMSAAGAPAGAIAIAIEAIETVRGSSRDDVDASRDALLTRRERDRVRQQEKRDRIKASREAAKANDVAARPQSSADASRDGVDERCELTVLSSLTEFQEVTEKVSKGDRTEQVEGRKRGARLPPDWQPDETLCQFARDHNVDPDQLRAEFVDYWIAIPGQRGAKTNWPATWRNRVRTIQTYRKDKNGKDRSVIAAQDRLNSKLAEFSEPDLLGGVRREAGPSDVRLLPARRSG